jgi:hypothetical protein
MKIVDNFYATIFVGAKEHYDGKVHTYEEAKKICQDYCDIVSYCVTLTPTEFIYKDGNEPGFIIGLINYPRFPSTQNDINSKAILIAKTFMHEFNQYRISIQTSNQTIMLEQENDI